jgi:general secretion pathway protein K
VNSTENERGFALVAVLWGVGILSLLAAAIIAAAQFSARSAGEEWNRAKMEAAAEAGIVRGLIAIADGPMDWDRQAAGTGHEFEFDGHRIAIEIEDELGKIDLNAADRSIFERLFRLAGADQDLAGRLADETLDWRTPGDLRSLHGASKNDYAAAGLPYVPRDGPFQSVDELRLVLGMTTQIFESVRPTLTVYSHRSMIDPEAAPKLALMAVMGLTEEQADAMLARRHAAVPSDGESQRQAPALRPAQPGRTFTISAQIASRDARIERRCIALWTADPARPYLTLDWR